MTDIFREGVKIMAQVFVYRARNRQGKIVRGSITADSTRTALAMLRVKNLFVMEMNRGKPAVGTGLKFWGPKVGKEELALFCRQFATMFSSGVPIMQCLSILSQQTDNKKLVDAIDGMIEMLKKGRSLAETARFYPGVFPGIFVSMMEAGEISGALDEVMERLANHFEKEHDLREKVKSAMIYPAVVTVVAVLAVAAIMMFVLPTFVKMLTEYNVDLPPMTKIIMGASDYMCNYWYIFILLFISICFMHKRFTATRRGRAITDGILLKLPVFGGLIRYMIISRFARTLGNLLACGVPLLQAFDVVKKIAGNALVENAITEAAECVKEGQGIALPLEKSGIFPPMVTRMIAVGEEAGSLDLLLEKLADFYDREVENIVSRISSILEPVLIMGMGIVIGFIIMSVMIPMFNIMSSVN